LIVLITLQRSAFGTTPSINLEAARRGCEQQSPENFVTFLGWVRFRA